MKTIACTTIPDPFIAGAMFRNSFIKRAVIRISFITRAAIRNSFIAGATALMLLLGGPGFLGGPGIANAQSAPTWLSLDEGQVLASTDKKVLFIFVEAEWCGICKRMKKEVFPNADILALLENRFATVSIDLDSKHSVVFNGKDFTERSFAESMDVIATPTMIFADQDGKILGETAGFYGEDRFLLLLSFLDSERFQEMTFEEFEKERVLGASGSDIMPR